MANDYLRWADEEPPLAFWSEGARIESVSANSEILFKTLPQETVDREAPFQFFPPVLCKASTGIFELHWDASNVSTHCVFECSVCQSVWDATAGVI